MLQRDEDVVGGGVVECMGRTILCGSDIIRVGFAWRVEFLSLFGLGCSDI